MTHVLERVHIVLLRPQGAANLGAVARAMKNFGLQRLTLVDSRIGSWVDAHRMAVHADDVLRAAASEARLDDALGSSSFVVATTSAPLAGLRVLTPRELAREAGERGELTLLFGGEQNGLEPAELLRCHAAATIPTASAQPSLNLAQAVVVFAAELFVQLAAARTSEAASAPPRASAEMLRRLEQALASLLGESAWTDATRGKHAIAELVQPFWRAQLTDDEVRSWLVALGKAAQRPRR